MCTGHSGNVCEREDYSSETTGIKVACHEMTQAGPGRLASSLSDGTKRRHEGGDGARPPTGHTLHASHGGELREALTHASVVRVTAAEVQAVLQQHKVRSKSCQAAACFMTEPSGIQCLLLHSSDVCER